MKKYALAIDVGASFLRVGVGDRSGNIIEKVKIRTPKNIRDIPRNIIKIVESKFSKYLKLVEGGCIASIGPLDIKRGEIISPPNIRRGRIKIVQELSESLNVEFTLLNDAVAGVWGEKTYGLNGKAENLVYLTISTGIGAGVIVDNRVLLGKDGNAHEVGHVVISYDSALKCNCGGIGHWEAYASGSGIPKFTKTIYYSNPEKYIYSTLKPIIEIDSLKSEHVLKAARKGDALGRDVVRELAKINAAGVSTIINSYDPELIIIGGSIALRNVDLIVKPLKPIVKHYAINRVPEIRVTKLGEDVVLKGAVATVFNPPI